MRVDIHARRRPSSPVTIFTVKHEDLVTRMEELYRKGWARAVAWRPGDRVHEAGGICIDEVTGHRIWWADSCDEAVAS